MLLNARVTAFNVSELLRENQQGGGGEGVKKVELFTEIFKSLTIFRKSFIIDVRLGPNYVSAERYLYSSGI